MDHRARALFLDHALCTADPVTGLMEVQYRYSHKRQSGRVYATNSIQQASKAIRSYCSYGMLDDLDICRSFPTMLLHACEMLGWNTPNLRAYTMDKGGMIIGDIMKEFGLTYETVKRSFLVSLHCGSYRGVCTEWQAVPQLDTFAAEIQSIAEEMYELPQYKSIKTHVENEKGKHDNKLGSFVSHVCQDMESKVIESARLFIGNEGLTVRVNMYDGLMVEKENAPRTCDPEFLREMEDFVFRDTGCCVQFAVKPIKDYTLEEICSSSVAPEETDKVVLFGLEGTLVMLGKIRPGAAEVLATLVAEPTTKIGLFTGATNHETQQRVEWLEKELHVRFDYVLTGAHCYPDAAASGKWMLLPEEEKEDNNMKKKKKEKTHKSLSHHFPNTQSVVLIDTNPELIVTRDRSKVWSWEEEEKRGWTFKVPHHRDGLTLSAFPVVNRVVAKTRYMLDDPAMNPDTPTGKATLTKWTRTAVLTGPQGVGKSFAALELIRSSLQPDTCAVIIAPSCALATQLARDLRAHLATKNDQRKVLCYLDNNARDLKAGRESSFMVIGPLSLKHHLAQLHGRKLGIVVIDELPELRQMLATFVEAGRLELEESQMGIAHILERSQKSLFISAQMQDNDIEWATDMMTTGVHKEQEVLLFDSDHTPRETVTWRVKNVSHLRNLIAGFLDEGKRVVCFAETVEMVTRLSEWAGKRYQDRKVVRVFTAVESGALQKADVEVSEYGKGCDFFLYTTALGLGMNLTPEFDARFMLADAGFTSAKRLAQLANRARNCTTPDLYVCFCPSIWRRTPGDTIEDMARNKVISEYQDSLVPTIIDGKLERTLPDNPVNKARLELALVAVKETVPAYKLDRLHHWSDSNSRFGGDSVGYFNEYPSDEDWKQENPQQKLWDDQAVFLTRAELVDSMLEDCEDGTPNSASVMMAAVNFRACNSIMPYMTKSNNNDNNKVLPKDLPFDLFEGENCKKLKNFLHLMDHGRVEGLGVLSTTKIATAILAACGPMLNVQQMSGTLEYVQDLFSMETTILDLQEQSKTDLQEQSKTLLADQWRRIDTRRNVSKKMPTVGTEEWWVFVRWFMNAQFGFGIQHNNNNNNKKGGEHTTTTTTSRMLVPNGFWKKHKIDIVQVGLAHRQRTRTQKQDGIQSHLNVPLQHEGRPYGVLKGEKRKCFKCPSDREPIMCVRQNETWLCITADLRDGDVSSRCHRDYKSPIDTGYLDEVIPDDERKDGMIIEEITDDEESEHEQERLQIVEDKLALLPASHRQLLRDLGFAQGVYTVTSEQMKQAWEGATEVAYLESIQLGLCVHDSAKLNTVRKVASMFLRHCNLSLKSAQKRCNGVRVYIYTLCYFAVIS
jgi:hypothetical protein